MSVIFGFTFCPVGDWKISLHIYMELTVHFLLPIIFLRPCSDDKDFETRSLELRTFFVERGYPTHLLDSVSQKAFSISRWDTLKPPLLKISDDKIPS